jgi:hypothetical protein
MLHTIQRISLLSKQRCSLAFVLAEMAGDAQTENTESVNKSAAHDDKADNRPEHLDCLLAIRVRWRELWWVRQWLASASLERCTSFNSQEDCSQAHGSKVSTEECFAESADIGVESVGCKHDGNTAEEQNQCGKPEKSQRRDERSDVAGCECFPGHDSTEVDEHGRVEQEVGHVWKMGVLDLLAEPAVSSKTVASTESYKEIVRAKNAAHTDTEDGKKQIEDDHAGRVDIATAIREAQESVENSSDDKTNCDANGTLPEYGNEEILLDCSRRSSMNECIQSNVEEAAERCKP